MYDYSQAGFRRLPVAHVVDGRVTAAKAELMCVVDNADDFAHAFGIAGMGVADAQPLADRVFVGEVDVRETSVDDDHRLGIEPVAVVTIPSQTLLPEPIPTGIWTVKLPDPGELPSGPYVVRVILDIGLDHYIGVEKQVEVHRETLVADTLP